MQTKELDIEVFIENFNKDFHTKIKSRNVPFLKLFYDNFVNIFSSESSMNKEKLEEIVELEDVINKTFNEKQSILFKKWNDIQVQYSSNAIEQAFIYGFCICKQLDIESDR